MTDKPDVRDINEKRIASDFRDAVADSVPTRDAVERVLGDMPDWKLVEMTRLNSKYPSVPYEVGVMFGTACSFYIKHGVSLADLVRILELTVGFMPPERLDSAERERLGRLVREVWVAWAREQPEPKPSWLLPWEALSEPDREVDRRIGERLYAEGRRGS